MSVRFWERRIDVRFVSWLARFSNPWPLVAFKMVPRARTVRPANSDRDALLFVPYEDGGTALGITGFVLGLDGEQHTVERNRLTPILADARIGDPHAEGLGVVDEILAIGLPSGNPFDVKVICEKAISAWAAKLFGVAENYEGTTDGAQGSGFLSANLMQIGRAVTSRTVFNTHFLKTFDEELAVADNAVVELFRESIQPDPPNVVPAPPGCIHALLQDSDSNTATNDMIGLIGGATELMIESVLSILDWALANPKNWRKAHEEARKAQAPSQFVEKVASLMSVAPPQYFLIRKGTEGPTEGQDLTLVGLWEQTTFPTNVSVNDPVFGIAPHRCLGRSLALDALAHLLHPIFLHATAKASPRHKPSAPPINRPTWITLGQYFPPNPPASNPPAPTPVVSITEP